MSRFRPIMAITGFIVVVALGLLGFVGKKKDEPFKPVIHQTGPAPVVTPDQLP